MQAVSQRLSNCCFLRERWLIPGLIGPSFASLHPQPHHRLHLRRSRANDDPDFTSTSASAACKGRVRRRLCVPQNSAIRHVVCKAYTEFGKPWICEAGPSVSVNPSEMPLHVVLVSPQIPGNTGSIARTCAATLINLHLVEPLGFEIDDSKLKRAGLDYWPYVVVKVHQSWTHFLEFFEQQEGAKRLIAFTKRGACSHTDVSFRPGDWLLFGSETKGLPAEALHECSAGKYAGGTVRIPMCDAYVRSLNLAVSVGVGLYEALRQLKLHDNLNLDLSLTADTGTESLSPEEQLIGFP